MFLGSLSLLLNYILFTHCYLLACCCFYLLLVMYNCYCFIIAYLNVILLHFIIYFLLLTISCPECVMSDGWNINPLNK